MERIKNLTTRFLDEVDSIEVDKEIAFEYITDMVERRAKKEKDESGELTSEELQNLIIDILKRNKNLTASEIQSMLELSYPHLTVSDINSGLYRMKGKKTYFSGRPRVWNIFETVLYEDDVLDYLKEERELYHILDYVKNILGYGKARKKNINALLHRFLNEGRVSKTEDGVWWAKY